MYISQNWVKPGSAQAYSECKGESRYITVKPSSTQAHSEFKWESLYRKVTPSWTQAHSQSKGESCYRKVKPSSTQALADSEFKWEQNSGTIHSNLAASTFKWESCYRTFEHLNALPSTFRIQVRIRVHYQTQVSASTFNSSVILGTVKKSNTSYNVITFRIQVGIQVASTQLNASTFRIQVRIMLSFLYNKSHPA